MKYIKKYGVIVLGGVLVSAYTVMSGFIMTDWEYWFITFSFPIFGWLLVPMQINYDRKMSFIAELENAINSDRVIINAGNKTGGTLEIKVVENSEVK